MQLYGGALTTNLPQNLVDVSTFREVPDNQEVFILEKGVLDISLIFDVLEHATKDLESSVALHVEDVFGDNSYKSVENIQLEHLNTEARIVAIDMAEVKSYMAIIRLETVSTDIVITCNFPARGEELEQLAYKTFREAVLSLRVEDWLLFS